MKLRQKDNNNSETHNYIKSKKRHSSELCANKEYNVAIY